MDFFHPNVRGIFRALIAALVIMTLPLTLTLSHAAPLKILLQEEGGSEADSAGIATRLAALKKILDKALGRPVEFSATANRARTVSAMEGNLADIYILQSSDLASKAVTLLKHSFIAAARPDVNVLFIGFGAKVDTPKAFAGKSIAMPKTDSSFGQICLGELRDFGATGVMPHHSNEIGAVIWAVENKVDSVGCIPSSSRMKDSLAAKKINVLYEGRLMQTFLVIGSPNLAPADRAALTKALVSLDESEAGEASVKPLGLTGFTESGEARLRTLGSFLPVK